ncbi:MAG: SPFH/Band 7/PHB domain protein [Thermaerobacter sp.]|nr:SPFH/Band 7/PHB domain protein [Thermaerobacter sp.]
MSLTGWIIVIIIVLLLLGLRIVQQGTQGVIVRFGRYSRPAQAGIAFIIPLAERMMRVSTRSQTVQLPASPVLTGDNVSPVIDAYFVYRVIDPRAFLFEISNPVETVQAIMFSTIRRVIAEMHLSEAMAARDKIDAELRHELDQKTAGWGFRVEQVSIRDFQLPNEMKAAMEQQKIADSQRHAAINRAEGEKQSAILAAEGQRAAAIAQAEGEAQAILNVATAQARAITQVYGAYLAAGGEDARDAVLTVRALETLERVANGQATTILLPNNLAGIAGTLAALTEIGKSGT